MEDEHVGVIKSSLSEEINQFITPASCQEGCAARYSEAVMLQHFISRLYKFRLFISPWQIALAWPNYLYFGLFPRHYITVYY